MMYIGDTTEVFLLEVKFDMCLNERAGFGHKLHNICGASRMRKLREKMWNW